MKQGVIPYLVATDFTTYLDKICDVSEQPKICVFGTSLEETSPIGHFFYLAKFQCCLEYSWPTLSMPSLNITPELLAGFEDIIIIVLVMNGTCQAIAKHAFG
jgi:hypothetical protein